LARRASSLFVEADLIEDPRIGKGAKDLTREHRAKINHLRGPVLEAHSKREGSDLLEPGDCVYGVTQALTSEVQS
jgi:hypothetical protein